VTQWISSYGQANAGPNDGWYNVDHVVAVGMGTDPGGITYGVELFVTECGLPEPQWIYTGYATLADAATKAGEIAAEVGGDVS
jgi:hypothetical protein